MLSSQSFCNKLGAYGMSKDPKIINASPLKFEEKQAYVVDMITFNDNGEEQAMKFVALSGGPVYLDYDGDGEFDVEITDDNPNHEALHGLIFRAATQEQQAEEKLENIPEEDRYKYEGAKKNYISEMHQAQAIYLDGYATHFKADAETKKLLEQGITQRYNKATSEANFEFMGGDMALGKVLSYVNMWAEGLGSSKKADVMKRAKEVLDQNLTTEQKTKLLERFNSHVQEHSPMNPLDKKEINTILKDINPIKDSSASTQLERFQEAKKDHLGVDEPTTKAPQFNPEGLA